METNGSTDVTEALGVVKDWASGKIKMRLAQRKILDCHAFAKEIENKIRENFKPKEEKEEVQE